MSPHRTSAFQPTAMSVLLRLATPAATTLRLQQTASLSTTSASCLSKREKNYGYEPGHGAKNEVRKEKWIRKRLGPAPTGRKWRLNSGLVPNPLKAHALATTPDWSFKDGTPGYLSASQAEAVDIMKDLALDVRDALKYMKVKPEPSKAA